MSQASIFWFATYLSAAKSPCIRVRGLFFAWAKYFVALAVRMKCLNFASA